MKENTDIGNQQIDRVTITNMCCLMNEYLSAWTLIAEFDSEAQAAFKEKFPAWMDADDFELKC